MEKEKVKEEKFGTFHGVFRPTLLTIIGVMLYLREGWLVGNAGLVGSIMVILTAFLITGTTALSISSITSNTRVASGGVFALVSQSLGLEIGGAIGIPLYLAQGLSGAMYIHGFAEGWLFMFPEHKEYLNIILVLIFCITFMLVYISTKLAFKVQLLVMTLIVAAFVSMYAGVVTKDTLHKPEVFGTFSDGSFWDLFAVFFPAATGIMVGASMSGSLTSPKKSIPFGTMAAWGTALLIYVLAAVYYSLIADAETLKSTTTVGIQLARWPILVLIGVTASCFTATLSSLAAAPRVLQALGEYKIIPKNSWFANMRNNEPRNAMLFTGMMVLAATLLGDLNQLARILTMFFLITYFTINVVLVIEQSLNLISFRPVFKIKKIIPVIGALSSLTAIIIISPIMGLTSIGVIIFIYVYLDRKHLQAPWETVHSGLLVSVANWAAKKVSESGNVEPVRSWKPDLLVPVERDTYFEGLFRFLHALCYSQGSIQTIGLIYNKKESKHIKRLPELTMDMQKYKIFTSSALMETPSYAAGLNASVSVLKGSFFKPNTIFENISNRSEEELQTIISTARENEMGLILMAPHGDMGLGREKIVNLWIRDQSPEWKVDSDLANIDYALLVSNQLKKNWGAEVNIICVINDQNEMANAAKFIDTLLDFTRMAEKTKPVVVQDKFFEYLPKAPRADVNIFGISHETTKDAINSIVKTSQTSCLFVMDSGKESAMA